MTELQQLDVFSVGYEIDIVDELDVIIEKEKENKKIKDKETDENNVTNSFLVNSHLPFPVAGEYFNPSYVIEPQKEFEFELIKYLETKSNKPPIPIVIPVPDDPDNIPDDLSDVITGTIELTFLDKIIPDDTVTDDPVPDVIPDKIIPDDTTPDDPVPDDNPQSTQDENSTIPVIVILVIVLGTAGFALWKRPSFVRKGKNKKNKQNITKTRISFDDKIKLNIQTIADNDEDKKNDNLLLSKSE